VLVPAFETLASVAEQDGTRRHQFMAIRRAIVEGTGGNHGDGESGVPLFEWPILRTGITNYVRYGPPDALRKDSGSWRNISQEFTSSHAL
jgi:hypothetical protein